ncbi:MAG TPA: MBL fold metallo-hydrolase [Steroidobacteraceae bacterium]|nr:MBL fold metallo-hydrolase [Steroidobacteraceae bacterium]
MQIQTLGSFTVHKVLEVELPGPLKMAFSDVSTADLEELKSWYWDPFLSLAPETAQMQLSMHSFVLSGRGRNILIDTCLGNHKQRSGPFGGGLDTPYLARLAEAGFSPADIDVVLCTHLHADHVGWNTRLQDGRWVPTFPNARYVFTRPDVEHFSRQREEVFNAEAFADSVLPIIEAGQADIVETRHTLDRDLEHGVWLEEAPGHSPGSCAIHVRSGSAHGIFSGDLFHHPIELVRPSMHFFADLDPVLTAQTRARMFEKFADTDTRFFPAHFIDPTAGRLLTRGRAFEYRFV